MAFAGTPDFAAVVLRGLAGSRHGVGLVISQPDARRGRGRRTTPTPVAELARVAGLPLVQPSRIGDVAEEISRHDALVVAAYGQILRPDTLFAARSGAWNVHASLLPKYRGAAPVERAIMAGEERTGVTIMRMDEGLDTGEMALRRAADIGPETTGGELAERLAGIGAEAVVEALDLLESGDLTLTEQDNLHATYAAKISPEDSRIDWGRPAGEVHDLVRALSPRIGARALRPEGPGGSGNTGAVKIWRSRVADGEGVPLDPGRTRAGNGRILVGCGDGVLEVLELQAPGGRRLPARDFLAGNGVPGAFAVADAGR